MKHPSKVLTVGDEVEAMVLQVDSQERRIGLGLRQIEPNPWQQLAEKYQTGARIEGKVRNLTDFGAFVEVADCIDGLIHISDMSWNKRISHPSEVLKKGDTVDALVLNIDAENQRLSLGLKQMGEDTWEEFFNRHQEGDVVDGKVVRFTNFGAFIEIEEGIEGLLHVSEVDDERIEKAEDKLVVGDSYRMKIIKMSQQERKIALSIRAVNVEDYEAHYSSQGSPNVTLGDVADFGADWGSSSRANPETDSADKTESESEG